MSFKSLTGLLSILTFAVGCGDVAKVQSDDVNGLNANDAQFAIFAEDIDLDDFDNDGEFDDVRTNLIVVMSDDPNMCARIQEDPFLENAGDLVVVFGQVFTIDFNNDVVDVGGFVDGDIIEGEGFIGDVEDQDVDFAVQTNVQIFENNDLILNTFSEGKGTFAVKKNKLDNVLVAAFDDTLIFEAVDADNDGDIDVINDINADFTADIRADFCAALL